MRAVNKLARVTVRGHLRDFYLRMKEQDAQQFASGVTRSANDRNSNSAHRTTSA